MPRGAHVPAMACGARYAMRDARTPIRDAAPLAGSAGMCIEV